MSARKQPDVWVEIASRTYPGGVSTTTRRATKAMAFPTKIPGRVRSGSYSQIERGLSDWKGNVEAAVFSWEEEDSDGAGRTLAAELGRTSYANPEVTVKLLSEAGRKAGLTPRIVQRGYLSRVPQAASNRKTKFESVDALGSKFFRFDPEAPFQTEFITREHLEAAGILKIPAEKIGKPYNIILGEHSDAGSSTSCGDSAVKGMIPVDYVGRALLPLGTEGTITNIAPPTLTASLTGAGGSETYYYAVTAIFAGGVETAMSNIVTVTGAPSFDQMSVTNSVSLVWTWPTGGDWADVYGAVEHYRVIGRRHNPPTTYLDLGFHSATGGYYFDGGHDGSRTDRDIQKPLPASVTGGSCGTGTVIIGEDGQVVEEAGAWGIMVVALGAVEILSIYGSDLAEEDAPARAFIEPDNPDVISPLSGAWPHPTPYVDVNGTRLTLFYARGVILQHHIDNNVTFAVTVCGVEDIGDGTGTPITEAAYGLQWLISEISLNHYRTGAYGTLATYADGTSIIKTSAFEALQDATVEFIGGRGYQIHLALTEKVTLSDVLRMWCETFTAHIGVTQHGQITVHVIDPTVDPTTGKHFRERMEIDGPLPDADSAEDEVENRCRYRYDWDPDSQNYRVEQRTVEDLPSQGMYGIRDVDEDFLGLRCTRDATTADHSMGRRIRLNKVAPLYQEIPVGMIGMERNLGDVIRLTHPDGLGVDGYVEAAFFVVRQGMDLNSPQERVSLTARYIGENLVTALLVRDTSPDIRVSEAASVVGLSVPTESNTLGFSEAVSLVVTDKVTGYIGVNGRDTLFAMTEGATVSGTAFQQDEGRVTLGDAAYVVATTP